MLFNSSHTIFAVGWGSSSSTRILLAEYNELGYNTREGLEKAMKIATEISPGYSEPYDFIQESQSMRFLEEGILYE